MVSGISFNDTQSGSVDCYEVSDKEWVYDIDLNKGAGGDYIYMHLTTETKTNRPKTDPAGRDGLKYNGYYQHLMTVNLKDVNITGCTGDDSGGGIAHRNHQRRTVPA